ncbi:hypothetical protein B0H13DRAFT_2317560 [Mycena leptocephala]|nr:hypothetical protein B0H13DRAFT_2317560 [Mycena leptocephala]
MSQPNEPPAFMSQPIQPPPSSEEFNFTEDYSSFSPGVFDSLACLNNSVNPNLIMPDPFVSPPPIVSYHEEVSEDYAGGTITMKNCPAILATTSPPSAKPPAPSMRAGRRLSANPPPPLMSMRGTKTRHRCCKSRTTLLSHFLRRSAVEAPGARHPHTSPRHTSELKSVHLGTAVMSHRQCTRLERQTLATQCLRSQHPQQAPKKER